MRLSSADFVQQQEEGERRCLNSELWHACAGPLVSLPTVGSRVVYFPQGHSEQVAISTNKEVDSQIPNYSSLPPQLICQLHDVTMHADVETDEVYAQMTLQPLSPQEQKEIYLPAELGAPCKQPINYFCKTLTASDTSTHGGFSVPRRAAEKVFPPLDFTQQPPAQELFARDLHDNEWKFRHIFRGQPKRHLLTTGWSVFVSAKRLVAGDSVLFIWNEKNQLLLGIRRANRPQTVMPSSVLSSDSMHLGLLAAAAHAASTNSRFTIFYNPRACPSEFVIPLAKYVKAVYHTRVSVGMRFRMMFETEESSVRRYMGTITGISDLDSSRWSNSHWRSVKVGWDESTAGEKPPRVSLWEIEPLTSFPMYPSPFSLGLKRPWSSGMRDDRALSRLSWLQGDSSQLGMQPLNFPGVGVMPYFQQRFDLSMLGLSSNMYQAMASAALQDTRASLEPSRQASSSQLQFQQPQIIPGSSIAQPQILLQSQQYLQNLHGSQSFLQTQALSQSESLVQQQTLQTSMLRNQHIPKLASSGSQFASGSIPQASSLQSTASLCHEKLQHNPHENHASSNVHVSGPSVFVSQQQLQDIPSSLLNAPRADSLGSSSACLQKRARVDPAIPCEVSQGAYLPQVDHINPNFANTSQDSVSLPPFPGGREGTLDQEGAAGMQSNSMFGVNVDSPSMLLHGGFRSGDGSDTVALPFGSSNYMAPVADYALSCTNESSLLHSPDNMGHEDQPTANFVKVYKSGSYGRSLDITKFSSYPELRSELARMFGLEGQLEDPLRSGWQLVFVDKENDVLLLGDDPWMEFVNSVYYIKILSLEEVQQMGTQGLGLLDSVPVQKLSNNSICDSYSTLHQDPRNNISDGSIQKRSNNVCDGYSSLQDPRNVSGSSISCVGSLEY